MIYVIDFFWGGIFFTSTEIPRVINAMMTQNEAPEQPNEDPTYERYQSSEQKGKNINLIWSNYFSREEFEMKQNYRWSEVNLEKKWSKNKLFHKKLLFPWVISIYKAYCDFFSPHPIKQKKFSILIHIKISFHFSQMVFQSIKF